MNHNFGCLLTIAGCLVAVVSVGEAEAGGLAVGQSRSQIEAGAPATRARYDRKRRYGEEDDLALFEEGQYEFSAKDYRNARRAFEELLERFPKSRYALKAQKYLAMIYGRERRDQRDVANPAPRADPQSVARDPGNSRFVPQALPNREEKPQSGDGRESHTGQQDGGLVLVTDRRLQRALLFSAGDRVFFAEQSAVLGRKALIALRRQAKWLRRQQLDIWVRIVGHADDGGLAYDNVQLSRARALAVRDRLLQAGVRRDRIEVVAAGRTQRVAVCSDPGCAVQNRRVVVEVLRRGDMAAGGGRSGWTKSTR